jgi:hypothetical protein
MKGDNSGFVCGRTAKLGNVEYAVKGQAMKTLHGKSSTEQFQYETQFVSSLCAALPGYLSPQSSEFCMECEVGVGRSIADVVALLSLLKEWRQPQATLTTCECVVLSLLRANGPTRVDLLERKCGMPKGGLRGDALRRLLDWELIAVGKGGRIAFAPEIWPIKVVAIEAKLIKWRDALTQAVQYRRFADESFVALPELHAAPALKCRGEFFSHGIGLMVLKGESIHVEIQPTTSSDHDWRREFVLSRLATSGCCT